MAMLLLLLSALTVLFTPAVADDLLSVDFHAASCPQLDRIVRTAVQAALRREIALAAGLLRIFFHDCFPQGCDASVLLKGNATEQTMGPNTTLQPRALQLIDDIRAKVHAACGPTVSCTDVTALATRAAVVASGGPYPVPLGQRDSLAPAPEDDVNALPSPTTASVPELLAAFRGRGIRHVADLVALSGAHTVGTREGHLPLLRGPRRQPFVHAPASPLRACPSTLHPRNLHTPFVHAPGSAQLLPLQNPSPSCYLRAPDPAHRMPPPPPLHDPRVP
jgi:hypothetical protein